MFKCVLYVLFYSNYKMISCMGKVRQIFEDKVMIKPVLDINAQRYNRGIYV